MITIQIDPDLEYATRDFSFEQCEELATELLRLGKKLTRHQIPKPNPKLSPKVKQALNYLMGVAYWEVKGKRGNK